MSYTDLRDFAPDIIIPIPQHGAGDKPLTVAIEKSGGGSIRMSYTGSWRYRVTWDGEVRFQGQDLTTGMPHSHTEAAFLLVDWLTDLSEVGEPYSGEHKPTDEEMVMLNACHERFESWLMNNYSVDGDD